MFTNVYGANCVLKTYVCSQHGNDVFKFTMKKSALGCTKSKLNRCQIEHNIYFNVNSS